VVGPLDPGHHREPTFLPRAPLLLVENVLLQQGEEDSIVALSPHAPTRPIDPVMPSCRDNSTNFLDRN